MSRSKPSTKDLPSKDRNLWVQDARQQVPGDYPPLLRDKGSSTPPSNQDPGEAGRKQLDKLRQAVDKNKQLVQGQVKPQIDWGRKQAGALIEKDNKVKELEGQNKDLREQVKNLEAEKKTLSQDLDRLRGEMATKDGKLDRLEAECQMLKLALGDPAKVLLEITQQLVESNNVLESLLAASASAIPNGQRF